MGLNAPGWERGLTGLLLRLEVGGGAGSRGHGREGDRGIWDIRCTSQDRPGQTQPAGFLNSFSPFLTGSFTERRRGCFVSSHPHPPPVFWHFCPLPLFSSLTGSLFAFAPLTEFPTPGVSCPVDRNPQGVGIFCPLERMKTQVRHSPRRLASNIGLDHPTPPSLSPLTVIDSAP